MGRLFGTDGVRGIANAELTPELAFKLGKSGAHVLSKDKARPVVLIGKDTTPFWRYAGRRPQRRDPGGRRQCDQGRRSADSGDRIPGTRL